MKKMKNPCWKGYRPYGLKNKNGRKVPNCVPITEELGRENEWGRPELTKKMKKVTPGQWKEENDVETTEQETTQYHTELNPKLWADAKLDSSVREALMRIANSFLTDLEIALKVEDIILTGSNANYNWTKYSDLDLHIIVDLKNLREPNLTHLLKLIQAKKALWNNKHKITVKGYNVELYVQQKNEILVATGVYSLQKDRWLAQPLMVAQSIDHPTIKAKAKNLMNEIDAVILSGDEKQIKGMIDKIAQLRKAGLQDKGEFSTENLVFKVLRNTGYIAKLRNKLMTVFDKALTFEQFFPMLIERVVEVKKPLTTPITAQTTSGYLNGVPYSVKRNSLIARVMTSGLGGGDAAAVTLPRVFGPGFNVYVRGTPNKRLLKHEIGGHGSQIIKKGDLGYAADYVKGTLSSAGKVIGQKIKSGIENVRKALSVQPPTPPKPQPGPSKRRKISPITSTVRQIHTQHPMEIEANAAETDTRYESYVSEAKSAAWQRKEGKSEEGGLNRKGIASYRRENPGSKLSMAVTTKPSKLKKGSKSWKRRRSFCARMSGMKRRLTSDKTAKDPNSRINKALRKWNCSY